MKLLQGSELAGFIKERQAHQVRGLRQADGIIPKLAVVQTIPDPVIDTYVRLKQSYGQDILVDVEVYMVDQSEAAKVIKQLNDDPSVHGIIVQLPLQDPAETDALCNLVAPSKDVDGLGAKPKFDPATPMAIMWLLAGHGIDFNGKQVVIVGKGKLVGEPLAKILAQSDVAVSVVDQQTPDIHEVIETADIVITATGKPGLVTSAMLKEKAIVVDAGTASEHGKIVGDLADEVYERDDLTITPQKGGVGPLTICALFENVIRSARRVAEAQQ